MKRLNISHLVIFLILLAPLSGCKMNKMVKRADEVKYTVEKSPLEMHGDMVKFEISIKFPGKYFAEKATLTGNPVLKYDGGEEELESIVARGEKTEGDAKVIGYESGGTVSQEYELQYNPAMRQSTLEMVSITATNGKKTVTVPVPNEYNPLAKGVNATPCLVGKGLVVDNESGSMYGKAIIFEGTEPSIQTVDKKADIHYIIQKYNIRRTELRQDDVTKFLADIEQAKEDGVNLKAIKLQSYASPDGEIALNEALAEDRSESAKAWLADELEKGGFESPENLWSITSIKEDWNGFKQAMQASDIQDKQVIIDVLQKYSDPNVREAEVKKIGHIYPKLVTDILPELRRSEMSLTFERKQKTKEQILDLAQKEPDTTDILSKDEYLFAATELSGLDEKQTVYTNFKKAYPDDWRAYNNLGVIYLRKGDVTKAKQEFESAQDKEDGDNAYVLNNLGVILLGKCFEEKKAGNFKQYVQNRNEAKGKFEDAHSKKSIFEAKYNLGVIYIMEGDYTKAIDYIGRDSNTFNGALAFLLAEKYEDASRNANNIKKDEAIVYYLQAVIAARKGSNAQVEEYYKKAIAKDASLKDYAAKDIEFEKFRDIVK